jgi:hypothetical protein
VCRACLDDSIPQQPVWGVVAKLMAGSKYRRSPQGPECTIEAAGTKYKLSLVRANDENAIQEIQRFMEETFGQKEVDPIDVFKAGIEGKLLDGSKDIARYRVFTASDGMGNIQSVYAGGLIEMMNGQGNPSGKAMFMGAYAMTHPENRRRGIIRELYISSMMEAASDAFAADKKLSLVAAETSSSSERVWNTIGRRRAYIETGLNEYTELPYVQPALEFEPQTGLPAEGAGALPEHLMLHFLEGDADKIRLTAAVDSMYRWCNAYPESFFASARAYERHKAYIADIQNKLNDFIFSNGRLRLLSVGERAGLRQQGVTILEYTAADHETESL